MHDSYNDADIARLRQSAESLGLRLVKSRCRTPEDPAFGRFHLVTAMTNRHIAESVTFDQVQQHIDAEHSRAS